MGEVIYKNFKEREPKKKPLEKEYFDECFKIINLKLRHVWNEDEQQFDYFKDKIRRLFVATKIYEGADPSTEPLIREYL